MDRRSRPAGGVRRLQASSVGSGLGTRPQCRDAHCPRRAGRLSIGIPLLLCGVLVAVGAIRAAELAQIPKWVGVAGPVGLLLAAGIGVAIGFVLTDL